MNEIIEERIKVRQKDIQQLTDENFAKLTEEEIKPYMEKGWFYKETYSAVNLSNGEIRYFIPIKYL